MFQWSKVVKNGIIATAVMEIFYKATNLIFHHGIDVPYANGTTVSLTSPFFIYLIGFIIDLFGGVAFSMLFARLVRSKNYRTGILFALLFVWLIIDGLIFEPMGNAGILMLDLGFKAVTINLLAHVVYGFILGLMFHRDGIKSGIIILNRGESQIFG